MCLLHIRNENFKIKLNNINSTYSAELIAIIKCLEHIITKNHTNYLIVTDSLSALLGLTNIYSNHPIIQKIQSVLHTLQNSTTSKNVEFVWVPRHVEIDGNEEIDKSAKEATISPDLVLDNCIPKHDVKAFIKTVVNKKWSQDWEQKGVSKLRMIKTEVKTWKS